METDKNEQLWQAAKNGDEAEVRRLVVDEHADIEAKTGNDGWTPLHYAADKGHEGVVRLLLGLGADIEAKLLSGFTALHLAAWEGHEDVVRLLLGLGADIEAKTNSGWTALHWASWNGHNEGIVRLLHGLGANLEAKDNYGWTALHYAASRGHEGVVRLLHGFGANLEVKSAENSTPRDIADTYGIPTVVLLLDELRNSPAMRRINILARPRPPEIYIDTVEASGVAAYWAQCCGVTSGDVALILSFLDDSRDFAQARLVCKTWRRLADTTLESRGDAFFA